MKKYPAIAAVEFRDVSTGMYATDAMLKKSPIGFVKSGTITRGRFVVLFGGTTASVEEAYNEGLFWGSDNVLDSVMLADIHPQLHDAILGQRFLQSDGSLAILETSTICSNIRGSETALKGTPVEIIEIRLADSGLSGKGISILRGELSDIEAAVELFEGAVRQRGHDVTWKIIPSPHESMPTTLLDGTLFSKSKFVELDGESN